MKKIFPFLFLVLALALTRCDLNTTKKTGDKHISQGFEYYAQDRFEEAKQELFKGLEGGLQEYTEAEAYTFLGNVYNELEDFDSSIIYHEKAIALKPDYYEAWVNLGIVYRLETNYDKAEECYLKAMEIQPDYPELHASLGALYIFKEENKKAIEHLYRAIELDESLDIAHSNLSLALAMEGQFDEADRHLQRAIDLGYRNGPIIKEEIDFYRQQFQEKDAPED